jgi:Flp pilus assembly pilin Flp
MNRHRSTGAQTLIEYAIVVTLVTVAVSAMSTYLFRSVQTTQKAVESVGFNQ